MQCLDVESLISILGSRALSDDILRKTIIGSLGIRMARQNLFQAKVAIEYAVDLNEFIRYTEIGHGQILDEIKKALEYLANSGEQKLATELAEYAVELAGQALEKFEASWEWQSGLEELSNWAKANSL